MAYYFTSNADNEKQMIQQNFLLKMLHILVLPNLSDSVYFIAIISYSRRMNLHSPVLGNVLLISHTTKKFFQTLCGDTYILPLYH
jgi:hypothetical protein